MSQDGSHSSVGPQDVLFVILAFGFGVIFLGAILGIAIFNPDPTLFQWDIYRITIAIAAAGVAAVIPGFLDVGMGKGTRFALRAGGALAVFAVVFLVNPADRLNSAPADRLKSTPGDVSPQPKSTKGDASPIIDKNTGPVNNTSTVIKQ